MKATPFVFIYGPPAVGKLAVARELAALDAQRGWRVYHNHVSLDCVATVFDWFSPAFNEAVAAVRLTMIRSGIEHRIPLIFTFVYAKPVDDAFYLDLFDKVESAGGTVYPVRLTAQVETLRQRVLDPSRADTSKARTLEKLDEILRTYDTTHALPDRESLTIDTDQYSARQAAERIIRHIDDTL
jgi:hypothetical protein